MITPGSPDDNFADLEISASFSAEIWWNFVLLRSHLWGELLKASETHCRILTPISAIAFATQFFCLTRSVPPIKGGKTEAPKKKITRFSPVSDSPSLQQAFGRDFKNHHHLNCQEKRYPPKQIRKTFFDAWFTIEEYVSLSLHSLPTLFQPIRFRANKSANSLIIRVAKSWPFSSNHPQRGTSLL